MMILTTLSMVSFFKTRAPEKCVKKTFTLPKRTEIPFLRTIDHYKVMGITGNEKEDILCIERGNANQHRSGYLFSGTVEIHQINPIHITDLDDSGSLGYGLQIVVRKYTGELVGEVTYDYVYCGGYKCLDLNNGKIIKTIHQIKNDEKYHIYLNYEGNEKIELQMELCPGDEDILERFLKDYEENVSFSPIVK